MLAEAQRLCRAAALLASASARLLPCASLSPANLASVLRALTSPRAMEDDLLAPYASSSGYLLLLLEYVAAGASKGDDAGRAAVARGTYRESEALTTAVAVAPAIAYEPALRLVLVGLRAIARSFFVSSRILRIRASWSFTSSNVPRNPVPNSHS